jgi:HK97 family phage portal protein
VIVQSFGAVQSLTPARPLLLSNGGGALDVYGASRTYAAIWRSQPNVRTVTDFLSRNIAQLGLHVFKRIDDTDRVRLFDHDLARWMSRPNPATTRYRLIETLAQDLAVYFNAFWLKVRLVGDDIGLLRLPPAQVSVEGGLLPSRYVYTRTDGRPIDFDPNDLVVFNGYDPEHSLKGISPLETLRRILAEEAASSDHRQSFWLNAARFEGVIERPVTAPKWTETQSASWRSQWQSAFAAGGSRAGAVAVLEDGMTFKPLSFSPKDAEFLGARKLAREECAAAYHIPLPMVGILEHATFSNIVEQHKNLYQDCLGPWLVMIEEEIERQLLPECADSDHVYVEFNIAEKLKGSFEEQAASLQSLVGRPVMTANEGRARLNLPRLDDPSADELAAQQGGPASNSNPFAMRPSSTLPPPPTKTENNGETVATVLQAHRTRLAARLQKHPVAERSTAFFADADRWYRELVADLTPICGAAEAERVTVEAQTALFLAFDTEDTTP